MAISVDPVTYVITVPRDDLALVQLSPTEIRTMDLNWFRMELHNIMDNIEGMPMPKMFEHNTEVVLGGLTYARIIEILDPYSITFEDGQYAVNLTGANSNVADKTNVNQVSVRPQNSAGLISSADIEYSAFNGGITLDEINGYIGSGQISNGANIGTPRAPSNNMWDTEFIADYRGFSTIYVIGDASIPEYERDGITPFTIKDFTFIGSGKSSTNIDIPAITEMETCKYYDSHISGTLDGFNTLLNCYIDNLFYIKGYLEGCVLSPGVITLGGNDTAHFLDCFSGVPGEGTPTIDFGGSGQALAMRNYNGGIRLQNKNGIESASIDLNSGQVKIDLITVTNGTIVVRGIGKVVDANTGEEILTGYYGDLYILNEAMNQGNISVAVWDEPIEDHLIDGTTGKSVGITQFNGRVTIDANAGSSGIDFPLGTESSPVNNLTDAVAIAQEWGIDTLAFDSDYTFPAGTYIADYKLKGKGQQQTTFTFDGGPILSYCTVLNATVTGAVSGIVGYIDCTIEDLGSIGLVPSSISILTRGCYFKGTVTLPSNYSGILTAVDCVALPDSDGNPPVMDMGNSSADLQVRNWSGILRFKNVTEEVDIRVFLNSGGVVLEPSVTAGNYTLMGVGVLTDNSTSIDSLNIDGLMSKDTISTAVWDEQIADHLIEGSTGHSMGHQQFNGVVYVGTNGTAGTAFPQGTEAYPVDNVMDAVAIAMANGLHQFSMTSDFTVGAGTFEGFTISGNGRQSPILTFAGTKLNDMYFKDISITGTFEDTSVCEFTNCTLIDVHNVTMTATNCVFGGNITLGTVGDTNIYNSFDLIPGADKPIFSVGDCIGFGLWNWVGGIMITDMTNPSTVSTLEIWGRLTVDASNTQGSIIVRGPCSVYGETGGTEIISEGALNMTSISESVWGSSIGAQVSANVEFIKHIEGGKWKIENNQMTFYEDDNTTIVATFDLKDATGAPTDVNVYERERV